MVFSLCIQLSALSALLPARCSPLFPLCRVCPLASHLPCNSPRPLCSRCLCSTRSRRRCARERTASSMLTSPRSRRQGSTAMSNSRRLPPTRHPRRRVEMFRRGEFRGREAARWVRLHTIGWWKGWPPLPRSIQRCSHCNGPLWHSNITRNPCLARSSPLSSPPRTSSWRTGHRCRNPTLNRHIRHNRQATSAWSIVDDACHPSHPFPPHSPPISLRTHLPHLTSLTTHLPPH